MISELAICEHCGLEMVPNYIGAHYLWSDCVSALRKRTAELENALKEANEIVREGGMNRLYLVERTDNVDYDEYDGAVVAALDADDAVAILKEEHGDDACTWLGFKNIEVIEIKNYPRGVILDSYNAG